MAPESEHSDLSIVLSLLWPPGMQGWFLVLVCFLSVLVGVFI